MDTARVANVGDDGRPFGGNLRYQSLYEWFLRWNIYEFLFFGKFKLLGMAPRNI